MFNQKQEVYLKTKFILMFMLCGTLALNAQSNDFKHLEIGLSALIWSPTSAHMKATNQTYTIPMPNGHYTSSTVSGYGSGVAPNLNVKYYFNKNIGLSFNFKLIYLENYLNVQPTDTSSEEFDNIAYIAFFNLGFTGRFFPNKNLQPYYEMGITFCPSYDMEIKYSSNGNERPDLEAEGAALGLYFVGGVNIKLAKHFNLSTGVFYSFIPVAFEYSNSEGSVRSNVDTNLGGIGLQLGLNYSFL